MAILSKSLPALALLSGLATAYDGLGESVIGGRIDTQPPWAISTTELQQALSQPNATGQVQITGYNLSSTQPDLVETRDWTLRVSIRADVSLSSAQDRDLSSADKEKRMQMAILSVDAPDPFIINNAVDAHRLCAVVYPGLSDEATRKGQSDDGDCETALPEQCVKDLEAAAISSNNDQSKSCAAPTLPNSCKDSFLTQQSVVAFGKTPSAHPFPLRYRANIDRRAQQGGPRPQPVLRPRLPADRLPEPDPVGPCRHQHLARHLRLGPPGGFGPPQHQGRPALPARQQRHVWQPHPGHRPGA
jgi:hypothetical protein